MSCLLCPSYKTMNHDLVIGPFLHIRCPEGPLQVWWSASGRLLAGFFLSCPFVSHGRQAWNEYSKRGRLKVSYNLSKSAGVIFMNDAFMALIIKFALFAA